jgi:hypothetical protein
MQIALTPFPKGVDVKQFLQDRKKRTDGASVETLNTDKSLNLEGGTPLLGEVTGNGDEGPAAELTATPQGAGIVPDPAGSVVSTDVYSQQSHFQSGNSREGFRVEGQSNAVQAVQVENPDFGTIAAQVKEPKGTTIHTNSRTISAYLTSKEIKSTTQLQQSTAADSKGIFIDDYKSLRRSVCLINKCSSDGISTGDHDMLQKSMKRTAWKNLDGPAPQQLSPAEGKATASHSLEALPTDSCVSKLQCLGFSMGSSKQETNLAIKALKRIDIDRTRVEPKKSSANKLLCLDPNPFELSDEESSRPDSILLSQLVRDISEVGFDDEELDTKICDLRAHSRKSKTSGKKGRNTNKKSVSK